ncbi:MAG: hypothetical protein AB7I32_16430, partial [Gammaproteobacteria bacterium]
MSNTRFEPVAAASKPGASHRAGKSVDEREPEMAAVRGLETSTARAAEQSGCGIERKKNLATEDTESTEKIEKERSMHSSNARSHGRRA